MCCFVQQVVNHFLSQIASLAEDVDEPGPVLALADLPLSTIEVLGQQVTIDHQVAEEDDGIAPIFIYVANESLDMLWPQHVGLKTCDGVKLLLFEVADCFVPDFEHDACNLATSCLLSELS